MVWKGYNEEILQNRNKGWWRKWGKSLCALFLVSQTPGGLMLVMLANAHQKLWILPFFQHLRQTKSFFQFAGMEQEAEIELPLGTLEQGRIRFLPDFGETGTITNFYKYQYSTCYALSPIRNWWPTGKLIGSPLYFVFRFFDYLLFLDRHFI